MTSPLDPHTLFKEGSLREALGVLQQIEGNRPLLVNEIVLKAELFSRLGEPDAALELTSRLHKQRDLTKKQKCRLREISGYSFFRKGDIQKGIDQYRVGIEVAEEAQDLLEECKLRLQLFANQVHWIGPQVSDANPLDLRRKIHQVAEPGLTVSFHLVLAEFAAKAALVSRARRYLETARALLPALTDSSILARFRHNEVALLAEEGDFDGALQLALKLKSSNDASANEDLNFATLVGHIYIAQANFQQAEVWLQRGLDENRLSGGGRIAHLDTFMLLRLCEGRLEEAGQLADSIESLLNATASGESFFGRWHLVTRVKWLFKTNRVNEGLLAITDGIAKALERADVSLTNRLRTLAAEGCALSGKVERGISFLREVLNSEPDPPLEAFAERCRVFGLLVAQSDREAAIAHFSRAASILRAIGNVASASDIEASVRDFNQVQIANPQEKNVRNSTETIHRLAAMLEMGTHPAALAAELFSLLSGIDCVQHARLLQISDDSREVLATYQSERQSNDTERQAFEISVGEQRGRRFAIEGEMHDTAQDYFTLVSLESLTRKAITVDAHRQNEREQTALWPEQSAEQQLGLVCSSERMLELINTIRRVASSNITVLLTGETGVGKELFARALHQASARKDHPFLPFNCTTVSRDMMDSQLFGHRRGSFTGALEDSPGLIRATAGGTLFLDEIGEMSIESQPKLLRFLESGEVLPLGHHKTELVDVRIVAATNANLEQLVADGKFREDLYYRLNVVRVTIPPLRERREEIPALVDYFLDRFSREQQKPLPRVADETLEYLVLFRWPGNVRQLANEIRRMVALTEPGAVLMPAHLSAEIAASRRTIPTDRPVASDTEVLARIDQPLAAAVEHVERAAIQRAMAVCGGRVDDAAKLLGLSRKGLYLKRQRLKIEDSDLRRS